MTIYHFTDTARLPRILLSGELRPGTIAERHLDDLLWATTNPKGDRTASSFWDGPCNAVLQIRFTLRDDDFTAAPGTAKGRPARPLACRE